MAKSRQPSQRERLVLTGLVAAGATLAVRALIGDSQGALASEGPVASADQALQRLKEGNERFVAGKSAHPNQASARRAEVAGSQKPFAIVFGCMDSRVSPELIFDRGLGDLLVVRTAGHVLDNAALGSIEFGVGELHVPLVLVLGHQRCGAVAAAVEASGTGVRARGQVASLVEGIRPAIEKVKGQPGDPVDNVVKANVELTVRRLRSSMPVLVESWDQGRIKILGARYDLDRGVVEVITP